MKKLIALIILLVGCTSEVDAIRALDAEGYKDIKFTGYQWFDCGRDDTYHTGFEAINREGKIVRGTVCSGFLFKNATIRY